MAVTRFAEMPTRRATAAKGICWASKQNQRLEQQREARKFSFKTLRHRHGPLANELNRSRLPDSAALLRALAGTLGVLQQAPRAFLQSGKGLDEASILRLIGGRAAAKAARDFAAADRIRNELAEQGVELKDSAHGTTWVRA